MKNKAEKATQGAKKKRIITIKKAISRFISNTQKIVQKVKPEAQIVIPKKKSSEKKPVQVPVKDKNKGQSPTENPVRVILVPDFNGKL